MWYKIVPTQVVVKSSKIVPTDYLPTDWRGRIGLVKITVGNHNNKDGVAQLEILLIAFE